MPAVASCPWNANVTAWLNQPLRSGGRTGIAFITWGAVASYLNPKELTPLALPARSVQEPTTEDAAASGPAYVGSEQDAMPEVASVPAKPTVSGWLYQPLASGARPAEAPVTCGAVASYSRPSDRTVVLPALSEHEPLTAPRSSSGPAYVFGAAHESSPEVVSTPLNDTETGWLYQPFPSGPLAGVAATCGPVASYLSASEATPRLPALSTQVPFTATEPLSGPE